MAAVAGAWAACGKVSGAPPQKESPGRDCIAGLPRGAEGAEGACVRTLGGQLGRWEEGPWCWQVRDEGCGGWA